ncbi:MULTISPECIES: FecR family protein [Bacteroides]|uniref:FecR family protein n=1 Tax=Bacteroides TaxID=816 RepID=UPI0023F8B831|nr:MULTISPECIES: FecR domain-containing protein [Bacteroides]
MNLNRELLYRFFNKETTLEEEKKIRLWIEESDENRQEFFRERKLFDAILLHGDLAYKKVRTRFYIPWRRIAAALSGVAAIVLLTIYVTTYFLQQSFRDETMNTVIVPQGQRVSLTLADGTKVWLNAKTKMEYPQSFKAFDERIVKVDGEAYFEVSKNKNRPFIVKTSKGDIEVLGTKFYVSAYATTDIFETSLIEGRVKVHTAYEDMTLYPRDKAVLQNGILTRKHIDDMDIYRWRDGLYCFKNLSFEDVLKQFEIYYDVRFVKENPQMANPKLNGKFRLIDGVDYALRVLQREVGFSFRRDEETSVIYLK